MQGVSSSAEALKQQNWPRAEKGRERKLPNLQSARGQRKRVSLSESETERERTDGRKSDGRFPGREREGEKVGAGVREMSGCEGEKKSEESGAEVADELEEGLTLIAEEAKRKRGRLWRSLLTRGWIL